MSSSWTKLAFRKKKEVSNLNKTTADEISNIHKPTVDESATASSSKKSPDIELKLLYDGAGPYNPPDVDFIAVHGIGGHPIKSFTDAETGCCWLQDLLPLEFPDCRVFSFSYDANPPKALENLSDLAKTFCFDLSMRNKWYEEASPRRLIFICHSVGGNLVQMVLNKACYDDTYVDLFRYTSGILFLGTPQRGVSLKGLALTRKVVEGVSPGFMERDTYSNTVTSDRMAEIFYQFRMITTTLSIASLYETIPTKPFGIIVDRDSTMLGFPAEIAWNLDAKHAELCKFRDREDLNYKKVLTLIKRFRKTALLADDIRDNHPIVSSPSSLEVRSSEWIPSVASKVGTTSTGLFEMAGSMEQPKNYSNSDLDIIAVHGLRGSPLRSWMDMHSRSIWLRDILQVAVSNSRVMTYGYLTEAVLSGNELNLDALVKDLLDNIIKSRESFGETTRPLIFICHSFGGILVKKALLHLRDQQHLKQAVISVIFLGVPHDVDDQNFAHRWSGIVQCTAGFNRSDILSAGELMGEIRQISTEFRNLKELEVCSVAESEPTRGSRTPQTMGKTVLVSADSSRLGWGERETIFLAKRKNHLDLPVLVGAEDPVYVCVRDTILHSLDRYGRVIGQRESEKILYALGRFDYDKRLREICEPDPDDRICRRILETEPTKGWLTKHHGFLLIHGGPGTGKSVLAKQLTQRIPGFLSPQVTKVLYYFTNFSDLHSNCNAIFSSFLHQLFRGSPSLIKHALKHFRALGEDFVGSTDVLIRTLCEAMTEEMETSFIIILDGLDELNMAEWHKWTYFTSQWGEIPNLGCITTTRKSPDILDWAKSQNATFISLESSDLNHDIEDYILRSFETNMAHRDYNMTYEELQLIKSSITNQASGSFLYARLVADNVNRLASEGASFSETMAEVNRFPTGLGSLYSQLIDEIENTQRTNELVQVRQILSILVVQREPMHLSALAEALQGDLDVDGYDVRRLRSKILGLKSLTLIEEDRVRLVHVSLESILLNMERSKQSSLARIESNHANLDMARQCVLAIYRHLSAESKLKDLKERSQDFVSYASKNWMIHFQISQELADKELTDLASGLFQTNSSPISRWISLYEEMTTEKLPDHEIFGPLFGGSYFGLLPVVKKALREGCDIGACDSDGKTSLIWACELGHTEVAITLLHHHANVHHQALDGRTGLHFAAQNDHRILVSELIASGADPNSATFDGQTALHLSIEAGNIGMVETLLGAGADATERNTSGLNAFQLAEQSTAASILPILMSSAGVPERLLSTSISQNRPEMVMLLMKYRQDVIESQYPWVVELVDEGLSSNEVSNLLLQSENLQWMPSEEWQPHSKRIWDDLPALNHHKGCAHHLLTAIFESPDPYLSQGIKKERDINKYIRRENSKHMSTDAPRVSSLDIVEEPLEFFARLEQREQKLMQRCGIGGVFPSWYPTFNPGSVVFWAGQASIMYGEPSSAQFFFPISATQKSKVIRAENPSRTQAGSTDAELDGSDMPSDLDNVSVFSDLSETSKRTESTYDSISRASNYEIWDQKVGRRILDALENVLNALHLLHTDTGCCESFTILAKVSSRNRTIIVKRISASFLLELCEALDQSTLASNTNSSSWTGPLAKACKDFLLEMECNEIIEQYFDDRLGHGISPHRCLHVCALITQMAAIGIVTYSRGHSREFYAPVLSRSVDSFVLLGSEPTGPRLYAERLNLDCMGRMLGRTVWVFYQEKRLIGNNTELYYLTTDIGDLLDTWGGNISYLDGTKQARLALSIGGGSIGTIESNDPRFSMAQDGELCCHWTADLGLSIDYLDLKGSGRRLLIGATSLNERCLLGAEVCQRAFSGGVLTSMGTRAPGWKTTGRAANLSLGFHGANIGATGTQTKDDGTPLKKRIFNDWDAKEDLRVLNRPCGLELSLCTGIARRVPLRSFFYGEVLEYLRLGLPGEWTQIQSIVTDIAQQSEKEFGDWLAALTDVQTQVMKKATVLLLLAMEYTGVERGGHDLTIWWPEKYEATARGLKIKKEQYSGKIPWIPMFQDPEKCAIFALATPRCLEHHSVKTCRNMTSPAKCEAVREVMLDTSLIPAAPLMNAIPLSYELNKRYVLSHCRHILRVTRASEATDAVVRVSMISGAPHIVIYKLLEKWEKVKEKETLGDIGQDVLVL